MSGSSPAEHGESALGVQGPAKKGRTGGLTTFLWGLPGSLWLAFFMIAPLGFIVLVSLWTYEQGAQSGFTTDWTFQNYLDLFGDNTYWANMLSSLATSVIAVVACLALGFPVAYFLAFKVTSVRNQVALFIIALAPFWTSYLTRSIAWTYPTMGREGGVNQLLRILGITEEPIDALGFSTLSVRLAMVQLYVLFMITPLFFQLAQVDRHAIEAARDLGASWWRMFREVILPQAMPGVVIGSIFIFVLTLGEYGTVRVIGGNKISSVGTIVQSRVELAIQYPQGAAAAVLLVLALVVGVTVITRFANLREDL